jgi:hypothetical protein
MSAPGGGVGLAEVGAGTGPPGPGAATGGSLRAARATATPAPVSTRTTAMAATAHTVRLFRIVKTLNESLLLDRYRPGPAATPSPADRGEDRPLSTAG